MTHRYHVDDDANPGDFNSFSDRVLAALGDRKMTAAGIANVLGETTDGVITALMDLRKSGEVRTSQDGPGQLVCWMRK